MYAGRGRRSPQLAGTGAGSKFSARADPDRAEADFAVFAEECDLARNAAARASLDEEFTGGRGHTLSLRWVYTHMIEEYARHNGHADLLRQRIDGATGS
jgi:hypothetical protein